MVRREEAELTPVARACVLALQTAGAAGERLILSAAPLFGNDVALAAEAVGVAGVTRGNPDPAFREALLPRMHRYDGSRAERVLGFSYRSKDETLRDTVAAVAGK
jgi:nucleoside-diphosphate-sugar epimerase